MTDGLKHLSMVMDIGFQLGQGKKVSLSEMADKHLTKECPRCEGSGEIVLDYTWGTSDDKGGNNYAECPDCGGTGRILA